MEIKDRGPWFTTHSGIHFYLFDPHSDDVRLNDIIIHLSVLTRFGGALGAPYTVGHHSLIMSIIAESRKWDDIEALVCLMHDFPEAYIGDVVRPFKQALPEVKNAERRVAQVIGEKYGVDIVDLISDVVLLDRRICKHEASVFGLANDDWEDPAFQDLTPFTDKESKIFNEYYKLDTRALQEELWKQFWRLYERVFVL